MSDNHDICPASVGEQAIARVAAAVAACWDCRAKVKGIRAGTSRSDAKSRNVGSDDRARASLTKTRNHTLINASIRMRSY